MRTTIGLEPYVLAGLKAMAQREGTTLGGVIERLYQKDRAQPESRFEHRNGIPLLPNRRKGAVITPREVKAIRDATEDSPRLYKGLRK